MPEKIFKLATITALLNIVLLLITIIVSIAFRTTWNSFVSECFSKETLFAIKLSIVTATLTTVISILIAIPVAYAISQNEFRGKDIVDTVLDLPLVFSPVALGASLLVFFNTPIGNFINTRVINFVFSFPGIVLAQVLVVNALAVRLLKSSFDTVNPRYEQVARTLGLNKIQVFCRVTLPMIKPALVGATILTWARAVGEFGATVTLAGATPMKTETLPIAIYLSLASANVDRAISLIFIMLVISGSCLFILRKITGRRQPV